MTARQRDAARSAGAIAVELSHWIDQRFTLPEPDLPELVGYEPEAAAEALRAHWGLGELSIPNCIHLLESKGVRVFSLAEECLEVDAFSMWCQGRPFVFLNTMKSAEHSRFDVAHELGHLVLHKNGGTGARSTTCCQEEEGRAAFEGHEAEHEEGSTAFGGREAEHEEGSAAFGGREAEREANMFASAFLMPRGSVLAVAPRYPSVDRLINLKRNWRVSVAALAHRLRALNLLTEWNYRTLCIEIGQRGYRKTEPEGIPRETSQVLNKVLTAMREEGISKADIARNLFISPKELNTLVFGLVMISMSGDDEAQIAPKPGRSRGHLRLV
jgi:Zn-dependent peptidase ImmA (M78 family)